MVVEIQEMTEDLGGGIKKLQRLYVIEQPSL